LHPGHLPREIQVGVCGTVFQDCAGEGFLTPGLAPGMPGVFVTLKNAKNVVVATNSTDANGRLLLL